MYMFCHLEIYCNFVNKVMSRWQLEWMYWKVVLVLFMIHFMLFMYNAISYNEYKSTFRDEQIRKEAEAFKSKDLLPQQHNIKMHNSSGYRLARYVKEQCRKLRKPYPFEFSHSFWIQRMHMIRVDRHVHTRRTNDTIKLYCPVEKVGTTFWRRAILQANFLKRVRHPYQIPIKMALGQNFLYPTGNATADVFKDNFKYFFVRNPFHRILSAYIDKLFVPNPQFWDEFGKHSVQMFRVNDSRTCYHDATFSEFVQFVVWSVSHMKHVDPHFLTSSVMCLPCSMEYSFIGKMESFSSDIYPVLEKLHLEQAIPALEKDLKRLSDLDALQDSIFSPYSWQEDILKCMDWKEAQQRVWRKLQMRGLIELDKKFPVTRTASDKINGTEFLEMATQAWKESDPVKLKKQKKDVFIEMYRSVPLNVLLELVNAYKVDFYLYDYEQFPNEIFNRSLHFTPRNFADFRN